jgi:non-canonical purine NTP pyrophosphatase (RdgB/HAM1 family)
MALLFLTGNAGKIAGAKLVFPDIKSLDIDLPEIQSLDPHVVIRHKLLEGLKHHKSELVVEDTSVYIEALNGLPGPLIKWFLESLGNEGLAELALKYDNQTAEVRSIVGYAKSPDDIRFFEGAQKGKVVMPRGNAGFGWNPSFQPDGSNKTFAEMSDAERSKFSMRTKAFRQLKDYLDSEVT